MEQRLKHNGERITVVVKFAPIEREEDIVDAVYLDLDWGRERVRVLSDGKFGSVTLWTEGDNLFFKRQTDVFFQDAMIHSFDKTHWKELVEAVTDFTKEEDSRREQVFQEMKEKFYSDIEKIKKDLKKSLK